MSNISFFLSRPTPDLYSVVLGEHTRSETSGFEVFRTLKRIIPHPLFNLQTLKHDIALVEVMFYC